MIVHRICHIKGFANGRTCRLKMEILFANVDKKRIFPDDYRRIGDRKLRTRPVCIFIVIPQVPGKCKCVWSGVRSNIKGRSNVTLVDYIIQEKIIPELPKARHQPITMPVTEAIESLTINLSNFVNPRTKLSEIIPEIKINARSFVLVYVPFKEGHLEFIQPDLQIAINKNILVHSKNL